MGLKVLVVLACAAFLFPAVMRATVLDISGRWEIVHISGDNSAQTNLYPGGFSTYLYSNGTGDIYGTAANSICVIDDDSTNVVPTWTTLENGDMQITITINNQGSGPISFVYTGTYNASTLIPGSNPSLSITAITGTYTTTGDVSACSTVTGASQPGNFVATFLADLSSGSSSGSLDGTDTDGATPFDQSSVATTINFSAPPTLGQIAGTVSFGTTPTVGSQACFAATAPATTPNPLTINSTLSTQAGILTSIYAEGMDPTGNPTTLVLNGYSANLYTIAPPNTNTDLTANPITTAEWAAGAAIGEDDPDPDGTQGIGNAGVSNDGTNAVMVQFYNVIGGACDGAGGPDAPFHFLAGKPVVHGHRKHHGHGKSPVRNRERDSR